jgi:hypothetical protein
MINEVYGRSTELMNKYVQKGLMVEEDSITLFSRVRKQFFTKNSTNLQDDFTKGTPDIYIGESILQAETIIDIKSSFDIFTFFNSKREELNKNYYWQLQTYMSLTGATHAEVVYCLVNTPDSIVEGQKRKFIWDAGIKGEDQYNHAVFDEISRMSEYEDIPIEERMFSFKFDRNDEDIERLHLRIILCRNWMNENFNSQK